MTIQTDLQSLTPGSAIEMFEVDTGAYGLGTLRFTANVNEKGEDIVWQGNIYTRFPIMVEGYEKSSKGTLPRPVMTIANVGGILGAFLRTHNSLLGAKVTRKQTLVKYLDAINFIEGNSKADPNSHYPDEIYYVDRKAGENPEAISLELAMAWDVSGTKLPLRQVIRDVCQWTYRDPDCSYTGPAVAKVDDSPTTSLAEDRCSLHVSGCKLRFGDNAPLPASFFPAVGLIR